MTIDLTGQHAVVTGAARGIGAAIADAFLEAGATVTAVDRDGEMLCRFAESRNTDRLSLTPLDICDSSAWEAFAASTSIDHLVCAAAIGSGVGGFPFWNQSIEDWERVIDVTLLGTIRTVHACTPSLLAGDTDRKSILLLASVAGQVGSQTDPPYSAAKAAVINFTQCAAKDFAPHGIRVNALSPGMVQTELNRSVYESNRESPEQTFEEWGAEKVRKVSPMARWQEPREFGAMAVFLASEHGRNITGQTVNIDGGQVMHS